MIRHASSLAACVCLCACGGAAPEPTAPEPAPPPSVAPEAVPETSEPAQPPDAPPPAAPRHVSVSEVEINGGGLDKPTLETALTAQADAFESCYAETAKEVPDLEGRVLVTYLFVKGERKSVSASHAGLGAKTINPCFHNAASNMKLEVDPSAERSTLVVTFQMAKVAK